MPSFDQPFSVRKAAAQLGPFQKSVLNALAPVLDRLLGLKPLADLYVKFRNSSRPTTSVAEFLGRVHSNLGITPVVREDSLQRIPKTGPLIVVCNHPYGAVEATVLFQVLSGIRSDVRFVANFVLGTLPETQDFCIYVNPFGGDKAARSNLQPLREAIDWVQKGGVLCVFPSGTVSHFHWRNREVTDPKWSPTVSRVIRKTTAPVVPIFFPGRNGWFFQAVGMISPVLRTLMLAREFWNKQNSEIHLRVGNVIPFEKLNRFATDVELITYLRLRTYILGNQGTTTQTAALNHSPTQKILKDSKPGRKLERIAPPVSSKAMEIELSRLPAHQQLCESGDLVVIYARAKQIPNVLREIGRLREISFREVNEGSGRSLDLDQYDAYYTQLFAWNRKKNEIVGAYRLGKTDKILRHLDKNGLYTSTLFDYRTSLLKQIGPALELGRSFIRHEYQRNYTSLLLLWRGIGHYVVRYPQYKILFGPVSINNEYDTVSRELITTFLRANNYLPELARLIKARNPMSKTKLLGMDIDTTSFVVKDVKDVSDLLHDIEAQQKSIPILLRQYLKLGGKLLGFNVDASFGDVLDGLIFIDLTETEHRLLERYLGREGAVQFLAYHGRTPQIRVRAGV